MMILSMDTSTMAACAAVADENKLSGEFFTDFKLKHSEKLMTLIDDLLKRLHIGIDDIDCFAVGKGPGSFTGLRIGAGAVKGLAQPHNKPIIGVSSLKACAFAQPCAPGELIVPIFDAQRSGLYTAVFTRERGSFIEIDGDSVKSADKYFDDLAVLGKNCVFCGDGVMNYSGRIKEKLGERARFADKAFMMPRASVIASLAMEMYKSGEYCGYNDFIPEYLRDADVQTGRQN